MVTNFQAKLNKLVIIFLPLVLLVNHTWSKLQPTGQAPCSRTAHAAACIGQKIIIHGGMNSVGAALDDVYTLDTG